jgi:hypothetical protein
LLEKFNGRDEKWEDDCRLDPWMSDGSWIETRDTGGMKWTLYPSPLPALKPYSANEPIPMLAEIMVEDWT